MDPRPCPGQFKLKYDRARSEYEPKPQQHAPRSRMSSWPRRGTDIVIRWLCTSRTDVPKTFLFEHDYRQPFAIPTKLVHCAFWLTWQRSLAPAPRPLGNSSASCSRRRSRKELLRPVVGLVWCASSGAFVSRSGSGACSAVTFARRGQRASDSACLSTCDGAVVGTDHPAAADLG